LANILLNKIPINKNGTSLFPYSQVKEYHDAIQESLNIRCPDDHYILFSLPTDLSKVDGDAHIIRIEAKAYSPNELLEAINKANKYDSLINSHESHIE